MQIFRTHQRSILIVVILLVGFSMLFFGVPMFWNGGQQAPGNQQVVASVAGMPITETEYRNSLRELADAMTPPGQEPPTPEEMEASGAATQALERVVNSALIRREVADRDFQLNQETLIEVLKQEPMFQDGEGNFDAEIWNRWVQSGRGDWNTVYENVERQLAQAVYMNMVQAGGTRVFDVELDEQLEEMYTKLRLQYLQVEPEVEATEEELQSYYETHLDQYREDDQRKLRFVKIPITPEPSQEVLNIVEQAREGADFAALAEEHSDLEGLEGGDMGWVAESPTEPAYRKPLFELQPGEVSDIVTTPSGFYIYKVEDERTNEEGQREVKARQIFVQAAMPASEADARREQADNLAAAAEEATLAEAAEGREVLETGFVTPETETVEGVPVNDVPMLTRSANTLQEGEVQVVSARENLYVVEVAEVQQGALIPFEQARTDVLADYQMQQQQSDEYQQRVQEIAQQIADEAGTIAEAREQFPQATTEPQEVGPIGIRDNLFQQGVYLQTNQIFSALRDAAPGELAGPVQGFLGDTFFLQLEERVPPTEEEQAEMQQEREQMREFALMQERNKYLQDYLQDLRERLGGEIEINQEALAGVHTAGEAPAGEAPAETPAEPAATEETAAG